MSNTNSISNTRLALGGIIASGIICCTTYYRARCNFWNIQSTIAHVRTTPMPPAIDIDLYNKFDKLIPLCLLPGMDRTQTLGFWKDLQTKVTHYQNHYKLVVQDVQRIKDEADRLEAQYPSLWSTLSNPQTELRSILGIHWDTMSKIEDIEATHFEIEGKLRWLRNLTFYQ